MSVYDNLKIIFESANFYKLKNDNKLPIYSFSYIADKVYIVTLNTTTNRWVVTPSTNDKTVPPKNTFYCYDPNDDAKIQELAELCNPIVAQIQPPPPATINFATFKKRYVEWCFTQCVLNKLNNAMITTSVNKILGVQQIVAYLIDVDNNNAIKKWHTISNDGSMWYADANLAATNGYLFRMNYDDCLLFYKKLTEFLYNPILNFLSFYLYYRNLVKTKGQILEGATLSTRYLI